MTMREKLLAEREIMIQEEMDNLPDYETLKRMYAKQTVSRRYKSLAKLM